MAKVVGIGGIFFKSKDPKATHECYREGLGVPVGEWGAMFKSTDADGTTATAVSSSFQADIKYFEPSTQPFMMNLRVDDLDGVLAQLRSKGPNVLDRREDTEQGRFGYVMDPDGNLVELWQPAPEDAPQAG